MGPDRLRSLHARWAAVFFLVWICGSLPTSRAWAEDMDANAFAATLKTLQGRMDACAAKAQACDPTSVPGPQQVKTSAGLHYAVHWDWLADALRSAQKASPQERASLMSACKQHLTELALQAGEADPLAPQMTFSRARQAANAVLARQEFRNVQEGPGWFDRQIARLQGYLLKAFSGLGRLGEKAPWLVPAIEWGCFALAAAGLLWFIRRSLQRQSLRISLSEGAILRSRMGRDAADWQRMSAEYAAAGNWREAVHCLYWAAVALLESRRAWQPDATRTPREYLRLLRPGSEAHSTLRGITQNFERTWYGQTEAGEDHYQTALQQFRALESAPADRARGQGQPNVGPVPMAEAS